LLLGDRKFKKMGTGKGTHHGHTIIKKIVLVACFICAIGHSSYAQKKYLLLDSLNQSFDVKKYTLKMDSLYRVASTVELFNIILPEQEDLVLISVLPPNLNDKGLWTKINIENIASDDFIKPADYNKYFKRPFAHYLKLEPRIDILIVKKEKDGYYLANFCFTQYFGLANHSTVFNTPINVINIGQSTLSIRDMEKIYKKDFPEQPYIMTEYFYNQTVSSMVPYGTNEQYMRMYLSDIFTIGKEKAYKFWTYAPWNIVDGWNYPRGIDRFIYIPGKGIVAGSFDFYFESYRQPERLSTFNLKTRSYDYTKKLSSISNTQWIDNILNEKIAIAEELK